MHKLAREMVFLGKGSTCANVSKWEETRPVVESWKCRGDLVGDWKGLGLYPRSGGLKASSTFHSALSVITTFLFSWECWKLAEVSSPHFKPWGKGKGLCLGVGILTQIRLVTNLVVYEIGIMAGGHSTSGSFYENGNEEAFVWNRFISLPYCTNKTCYRINFVLDSSFKKICVGCCVQSTGSA